jgi:hypothetical protein
MSVDVLWQGIGWWRVFGRVEQRLLFDCLDSLQQIGIACMHWPLRIPKAAVRYGLLLLCVAVSPGLVATWVEAAPAPQAAKPAGAGLVSHPRVQVVEGRVVAVRRLSREVTVRTSQGAVHQVFIPRHVAVAARGAAGLNAVRTGENIRLIVASNRTGKLVARAVSVR